jgi:hypothetical protein
MASESVQPLTELLRAAQAGDARPRRRCCAWPASDLRGKFARPAARFGVIDRRAQANLRKLLRSDTPKYRSHLANSVDGTDARKGFQAKGLD